MLEETLAIFEPPAAGEEVVAERVRIEVGEALGQAGDPRLVRAEENQIEIPGGTFWIGAQEDWEDPGSYPQAIRQVTVDPFFIGRYPVTVQEYEGFIEAGGYQETSLWHPHGWAWRETRCHLNPNSWKDQLRHPNRPVVKVSWYEANAFCRWAGGRLPSEAEWEFAARGVVARKYPWGNEEPTDERANFSYNVGETTPVGCYPGGATPEGVYDLAGNIMEWCDGFQDFPEELEVGPGGLKTGMWRVLRGGEFTSSARDLQAAHRNGSHPERRYGYIGFRVVWPLPGAGASCPMGGSAK